MHSLTRLSDFSTALVIRSHRYSRKAVTSRTIRTCLVTGLLMLVLIGCSSTAYYSSPYMTPLIGATIRLNQELSARAGARIYVQYGRVMSWSKLTIQEPYCQFYVLRTSEELRQPLNIEPDAFRIKQVFRRKDLTAVKGVQLAFRGIRHQQDLSPRTMSTYMELSSMLQPNVTRLICSRWADPVFWEHVSIEEIIETLGELARFETL